MPAIIQQKTADLKIAIDGATRTSGVGATASPTRKAKAQAGRIMYIECKAGGLTGNARIGRVTFSKTGRTLYYRGQAFQSLKGRGFKSNYDPNMEGRVTTSPTLDTATHVQEVGLVVTRPSML